MRCSSCGAEIGKDAVFCSSCGKAVDAGEKKLCPKCGAERGEQATFCSSCGYSFDGKGRGKKKNKVIPVAVVLLIVVCTVGGCVIYTARQNGIKAEKQAAYEAEQARLALVAEYAYKAMDLRDAIKGSTANFNVISAMFTTAMDSNGGLFGTAVLTNYAVELCSDEISEEKSRYIEIFELKKELDNVECDEEEIKELRDAVGELYLSYKDRYDFLVNCDFYSDFVSENKSSERDFEDKIETVEEIFAKLDLPDRESEDGEKVLERKEETL